MRAILIDPVCESVTEVNINASSELKRLLSDAEHGLKVESFDYVPLLAGDGIYVDDEGLMKEEPKYFFQIENRPARGYVPEAAEAIKALNVPVFVHLESTNRVFAGRGLIVGSDDETGDSADAVIRLEDAQRLVSFPKVRLKGFKTSEGKENHPVFGEMTVTNIEAVFEDAS
jgi:hypothetical protein